MDVQKEEFRRLEQQIARELDPLKRIDLLNDLAFRIHRNDQTRAAELAEEAAQLAEENQDTDRYARCLLTLAATDETRSRYTEGLANVSKAMDIYKKQGNQAGIANALNCGGILHRSRSDYGKALQWFTEAVELFESAGDVHRLAATLNNLGSVHEIGGDYSMALEAYLQALKLYEMERNEGNAAIVIGNIGNIYYYLNDFERSFDYHRKALKAEERMERPYGIAHMLGNISALYKKQENYESALESLERALKIFREIGEQRFEGTTLIKIGMLQELSGDQDGALRTFQEAADILEEINAEGDHSDALLRIGTLQANQSQVSDAVETLSKGLEKATRTGMEYILRNIHQALANAYKQKGDLAQAYHHLQEYQHQAEIIYGKEQSQARAEMQARFDVESAKREMEFHRERADYTERIAEQRSKELSTTAMHLVGKNKLLQNIHLGMKDVLEGATNASSSRLNDLLHQVEEDLRSGDDWQRFEEMYQLVHHDFIKKLSEQYPKLSGTELKVCALMHINLSNKEIADLLCISSRTIESHRYRIRKKMGLSGDINLAGYLAGL